MAYSGIFQNFLRFPGAFGAQKGWLQRNYAFQWGLAPNGSSKDQIQCFGMVWALEGSVMNCATDTHGNHVIRKAFDVADGVTNAKLISELAGSVMKCAMDSHGSHVVASRHHTTLGLGSVRL